VRPSGPSGGVNSSLTAKFDKVSVGSDGSSPTSCVVCCRYCSDRLVVVRVKACAPAELPGSLETYFRGVPWEGAPSVLGDGGPSGEQSLFLV